MCAPPVQAVSRGRELGSGEVRREGGTNNMLVRVLGPPPEARSRTLLIQMSRRPCEWQLERERDHSVCQRAAGPCA